MKMPRTRVAAIAVKEGSILLVKHYKNNKEYWLLPGGGVDYGETLASALKREVVEETSLTVNVNKMVMINESIPDDKHRHIINVYFLVDIISGSLKKGEDGGILKDAKFVPIEKFKGLTFYPDLKKEILKGIETNWSGGFEYLGNRWNE